MQLTITRAEASAKMREAYAQKKLVCQLDGVSGTYFHPDTGNKCAIGCLFSDDDAHFLQFGGAQGYRMAEDLINDGILVVDDAEWFDEVQELHDEACADSADMADFERAIGL